MEFDFLKKGINKTLLYKSNLKRIFQNLKKNTNLFDKQGRNLNFNKIASINLCVLFSYYLFNNQKRAFSLDKNAHTSNFSISSRHDFDYLLNLNISKDLFQFTKKKCPKIIFLRGYNETDEMKNKIYHNFEKVHSKYKDLESYVFDIRKNINSLTELENLLKYYGSSVQDLIKKEGEASKSDLDESQLKYHLLSKPFLFLNKYGDVKNYSLEEFSELSKSDSMYNYFEKLTILNNKHDLLVLNDYDYAFVIYLENKNIDYNDHAFKVFRKLYFLVNFFNIKFFVATKEHSKFLEEASEKSGVKLNLKNIYLIKRDNMVNSNEGYSKLTLEDEPYEVLNITEDLMKIPYKSEDGKSTY